MKNNTEKLFTLVELFKILKEKGWKQVDIAKQAGMKEQNISKMSTGVQKQTSFQKYFALKNLLTKEPPEVKTQASINLKHYMKGFADGVASVKEQL